jgi:hypothetical protein
VEDRVLCQAEKDDLPSHTTEIASQHRQGNVIHQLQTVPPNSVAFECAAGEDPHSVAFDDDARGPTILARAVTLAPHAIPQVSELIVPLQSELTSIEYKERPTGTRSHLTNQAKDFFRTPFQCAQAYGRASDPELRKALLFEFAAAF